MGATGIRIKDLAEIGPSTAEAAEAGQPATLEIITDETELLEPCRRDALDKPTRELEKYRQLGDPNYNQ